MDRRSPDNDTLEPAFVEGVDYRSIAPTIALTGQQPSASGTLRERLSGSVTLEGTLSDEQAATLRADFERLYRGPTPPAARFNDLPYYNREQLFPPDRPKVPWYRHLLALTSR